MVNSIFCITEQNYTRSKVLIFDYVAIKSLILIDNKTINSREIFIQIIININNYSLVDRS